MGSMFSDALWNGWNQMSPKFEEWWTEAFPEDSDFSWQNGNTRFNCIASTTHQINW